KILPNEFILPGLGGEGLLGSFRLRRGIPTYSQAQDRDCRENDHGQPTPTRRPISLAPGFPCLHIFTAVELFFVSLAHRRSPSPQNGIMHVPSQKNLYRY